MSYDDDLGLRIALENASKSYAEGGVPIGAALLYHGENGKYPRILGSGHNQRIQKSSATLHGETAALENAGRLRAEAYRPSTMVRRQRRWPQLQFGELTFLPGADLPSITPCCT